jgi:hypothetical protein
MKKQQIIFIILALALIIFCCLWKGNYNYEGFKILNPFDKVDVIYYINLDHRKDRKKELTEEFTEDLKDVFDETTNEHSMKDIMAQFMKDPKKLMGIMKKITDKLQNKMQNGDISQDELMGEIAGLVEKFKQMGGGEDFIKNFTNGPFAKMFKNMAGGASMNQVAQMGKQSAMKERLRKKMEEKKMREALATQAFATQALATQALATQTLASQATTQASAQTTSSQASAQAPKTYVVKIGDEKQEKSNAMSEEELVKMFKSKKKDKKKK